MGRLLVTLFSCLLLVIPACAQSQKSDREDEGLRGRVKSIFAEDAKLSNESGKSVEGKRSPSSTVSFDEKGNFTQQVFYRSSGDVHFTIKYSFIDGDKTSTIKYEEDPSSPPPPPAPAPSSSQVSTRPGDPGFDYKYKYKYDAQGNRVEEARYSNKGALSISDVSKFDPKGNRIEWSRYTSKGELNFRKTVSYNDRGQETELTYFGGDGSISEKYSYTDYVIDSQGNWIKRVESKLVTKNGKPYFEPYQVTYRDIKYY